MEKAVAEEVEVVENPTLMPKKDPPRAAETALLQLAMGLILLEISYQR